MRSKTPQIIWHDKNVPVFCNDFSPCSERLATGGGDNEIKMWRVDKRTDDDSPEVVYLCTLAAHQRAVNAVRFSPSGDLLASGSDDGVLLLWKRSDGLIEKWAVAHHISTSHGEVYDLCWSPSGQQLLTGHVDHASVLWDLADPRRPVCVANDHGHFVQGTAWDPLNEFVCTQGADRSCRVYYLKAEQEKLGKRSALIKGKRKNDPMIMLYDLFRLSRDGDEDGEEAKKQKKGAEADPSGTPATPATGGEEGAGGVPGTCAKGKAPPKPRLFLDDSFLTFRRSPAWSPDGALFVAPAAAAPPECKGYPSANTTYVFARRDLERPAFHLPCNKPSVAVRFSPVLYKLMPETGGTAPAKGPPDQPERAGVGVSGSLVQLPYRMVFAVACLNSVFFYDTQHPYPFAVAHGLHAANITDLSWSRDGRTVAISSRDHYCSFVYFAEGELGEALPGDQLPEAVKARPPPAALPAPQPANDFAAETSPVAVKRSGLGSTLQPRKRKHVVRDDEDEDAAKPPPAPKAPAAPPALVVLDDDTQPAPPAPSPPPPAPTSEPPSPAPSFASAPIPSVAPPEAEDAAAAGAKPRRRIQPTAVRSVDEPIAAPAAPIPAAPPAPAPDAPSAAPSDAAPAPAPVQAPLSVAAGAKAKRRIQPTAVASPTEAIPRPAARPPAPSPVPEAAAPVPAPSPAPASESAALAPAEAIPPQPAAEPPAVPAVMDSAPAS